MENILSIKNVVWEETNQFYDPEKANNGGGYSQPSIKLLFSDGAIFYIDDTSCGDFGSRVSVTVEKGSNNWTSYYGTMEDVYRSEIPAKIFSEHLQLIADRYGYHIPTKEECERWDAEAEWDDDEDMWEDNEEYWN